ncbi:MAG: hypothetical protein WBO69_04600 [Thermoanaerobaculia bacterium]|jgi:hypothetical protein
MTKPQYMIQVGDQRVVLPKGVTLADWNLEKYRWQNPRIRSLLGCIKLLEEVLESNYALLHCSPARLHLIWRQVRRVSQLISTRLVSLLEYPSIIPPLEEARQSVVGSLDMIEGTVLEELEQFPRDLPAERILEARKLLCVSIGKLHAFLQDTFSELLAADPRSDRDADYFLSRRFPRDIEEAEWLFASVKGLQKYLRGLESSRYSRLTSVSESIRRELHLPFGEFWVELKEYLVFLINDLSPRLNEILALRGIRFDEMEILDDYAMEIPSKSKMVIEIVDLGRRAVDQMKRDAGDDRSLREQNLHDLITVHAVLSRRLVSLLNDLDRRLSDLWVFVPIWLENIERRRALMLRRDVDEQSPFSIRARSRSLPQ